MSRYANSHPFVRCLHLIAIVVLLIGAFNLIPELNAQAARLIEPSDLLQFTAAGHILGFQAEGVYVAAGDHMLRVGFSGTKGVAPVAEGVATGDKQAQSMSRVTYSNLWPGVTLNYDRVAGGVVQSSYLLEPGSDVSQIRLCYNAPVEIEVGGGLRIKYETGQIRESAPIAWQYINGRRISVEVNFCILDSSICNPVVGFALGQYNPAYPLIIDPTLQWNTFMGSTNTDDSGRAIAVDGNGNVYVVGYSGAWGSPVNAFAGAGDAFVAKLDSDGSLLWNTFMGSSSTDYGYAIAVDGSGNVYVSGESLTTWGSPVNAYSGFSDVFVAKLDSDGSLLWNTFMGSSSNDYGRAVAVDVSGNVYVAGYSEATWGLPVNGFTDGENDVFAAKLNNNGVRQWNTFMGSSNNDLGWAIAVDTSGNVYVAGISNATWGSPVNAYTGSGWADAFAVKLNNSGVRQWNTFMGAENPDFGRAIAVDGSGNVYVAGWSEATWGAPINTLAGGADAFAVKLNNSGVRQWNTFLGGSSTDDGYAIAVDDNGNLYMAGESWATWGSPLNAFAGINDVFAVKLNRKGVRQWNTFMGSSSNDWGRAIALDGSGNVYVTGDSDDSWGSPVNAFAGPNDAFAAMLLPHLNSSEIIGTWSSGIWYWDVAALNWTQMNGSATTGDIAAGDFTGDGNADVASIWSSGLWYQDGATLGWTKISGTAPDIVTAGDVTGDGRFEIIGTWSSGIWYWDVVVSKWTQMISSTPDGDIAAGDFTGDGRADVASIWISGLWYQDGATLDWTKVSGAVPESVTAGDVTGDGRDEIIGTWSSGIWYWDVATSNWSRMISSTPTGEIAAGDFSGDGKADVASIWSNGLWYQDGDTLDWTKVSNTVPTRLTAGDVTGD